MSYIRYENKKSILGKVQIITVVVNTGGGGIMLLEACESFRVISGYSEPPSFPFGDNWRIGKLDRFPEIDGEIIPGNHEKGSFLKNKGFRKTTKEEERDIGFWIENQLSWILDDFKSCKQ